MAVLPPTMRAVVSTDEGGFTLQEVPTPTLESGSTQILVQVKACALNHIDYKSTILQKKAGNIMGLDFAGVVISTGSAVGAHSFRIGDRVAGAARGNIGPTGSFAEYLVIDPALVFSVPTDIPFESAAQLGTSCFAACQALYRVLDFPTPYEKGRTEDRSEVLVWSGSSSTGQYSVQLAALSGLRVISTSSPANYEFVKSLGADEVWDYNDSRTQKRVFSSTKGKLTSAVDCFSAGTTPGQVSGSLSKAGGKIVTMLPYTSRKKGVTTELVHGFTIYGEAVDLPGISIPASPEHYAHGVRYAQLITQLLVERKLQLGPIKVIPGGLAGIEQGVNLMRSGRVHAEKLVFTVSDTPADVNALETGTPCYM
ncbi:chaperonin 10-like protein [Panaeolus papilionaceus]|nr:chaperonin 10-like protein [Panaeolus papilionaceus]